MPFLLRTRILLVASGTPAAPVAVAASERHARYGLRR